MKIFPQAVQHEGVLRAERLGEWYVPSSGPLKFRVFIGMLFLPYTGMVLSYTIIGSLLAKHVYWDRVAAIVAIYFLALGLGAHALDAIGSRGMKPWGTLLSPRVLWPVALLSVAAAYAIGIYYIVTYVPWVAVIALAEGFFLFAYNLEWFGGRFHTDLWFAISWGALPVLAGYMLQTNHLSLEVLIMATATGLLSVVEIKASRPYKKLKRQATLSESERDCMYRFEAVLQSLSLGIILLGLALVVARWNVQAL